jgi:hypothetical protein
MVWKGVPEGLKNKFPLFHEKIMRKIVQLLG